MKKTTRPEHEIFADLAELCARPGYVHALAHLCFRDNIIAYQTAMRETDLIKMSAPDRLIRTEINTLQGLLIRNEVAWGLPSQRVIQDYIYASDRLLREMHECLSGGFFAALTQEALHGDSFNPFAMGSTLREPIFYSGDAAYTFQYHALAARKYAADAEWLLGNKRFDIEQASTVAKAIEAIFAENFNAVRERMRLTHPDNWTTLPFFVFTAHDVATRTKLAVGQVETILCAFTAREDERNPAFRSLQDFNAITATPLMRTPRGEFVLLQAQALAEALYEAPFYWMLQDKEYLPTLNKNRGDFSETFATERLALVFGSENVHSNVDIYATKGTRVSDVDVLVVWGDRLIVVQAKSKRLTLEARKGNDRAIRDDFEKGVQAAYDQAIACAQCLLTQGFRTVTADGREVTLPDTISEVYLLCVVSDHYPALSMQAKQFLRVREIQQVQPPLVLDVFALDVMTEMLQTPLQFLSYVHRRAKYDDQLLASQELTILAYHLKRNLWVKTDTAIMHLADDLTASLDIAMAARRTGVPGPQTPDGVLTRFRTTTVGRLVRQIESEPEPSTIDLGCLLLTLGEDAVVKMSRMLDALVSRTRKDGKVHDASFPLSGGAGITFHCTDEPVSHAAARLEHYCRRRKYREKAGSWFGLCIDSRGPNLRFALSVQGPWVFDAELDVTTQDMPQPVLISQAAQRLFSKRAEPTKVGRNDPCPCGSGRKHKKCCLV